MDETFVESSLIVVVNASTLARLRTLAPACAYLGVISLVVFLLAVPPRIALAEDIDTNPTADAFQQQIEQTAEAYNKAVEEVQAAETAIQDNQKRIAELEREIPRQQKRSETATRELYKLQQQHVGIIELLLSSDSFFGFLSNLEYIDRITAAHLGEIEQLASMKAELNAKQSDLEQARTDAVAHAEEAERALAAAQQARAEAQQRAKSGAQQSSGGTAGSTSRSDQSFSSTPSDTTATGNEDDSPAADGNNDSSPDPEPEPENEVVDDGADWMSDEDVFVSEWAGRIDAYLAGSPLSGQGATFARAAWNYGVDPRWSPAISCVESSKGLYCFQPHNAWGWGSASWDSWEEAIDAHVRGLARGYGYTISWEAACKYCPPNAEHWFNFTSSEMNKI